MDWLLLDSVMLLFVLLVVFCLLFAVEFLCVVVGSFRGETERRIGVVVEVVLLDNGLKTRDDCERLDILADLKGRGS